MEKTIGFFYIFSIGQSTRLCQLENKKKKVCCPDVCDICSPADWPLIRLAMKKKQR
jgi:hypothetical protein